MKERNRLGGRPSILHDRTQMLVSFERDRLREFEEYCIENRISVSQGLRELLEEFLEKKGLGESREPNPCHITYTNGKQKPFQLTLDSFRTREQTFITIKEMDPSFRPMLLPVGKNLIIADKFTRERIAAKDFRIVW